MIKKTAPSKINLKQFGLGLILGLFIGVVYNSFILYFESSFKYEINHLDAKSESNLLISNKCNYHQKYGPRILCAVFTHKANFETKAKSVNKTWGKRCDKTIYISGRLNNNEKTSSLNIVYLDIPEQSRLNLTAKTISTILYANKQLIDEFDWLLKADDDTYVLVENLKYFLATKCADDVKNYYGFRYFPKPPERFQLDFNSGGAGYLLSNSAVRMFSKKYNTDDMYCRNTSGSEDVDLAKCLAEINIKPGETRDKLGRERFHPLDFQNSWELSVDKTSYEMKHSKFIMKKDEGCCSESSISFHYTAESKALQLDFLLYNLKQKSYETNHNDYFS